MSQILNVKSYDNKTIILDQRQWKHIAYRHPEIAGRVMDIEAVIRYPEWVIERESNIRKCYKYLKNEGKYMMVAVKIMNGEGFIITAYFTAKGER